MATVMQHLHRDLNRLLGAKARPNTKPKTVLIAVFPNGLERTVKKRRGNFTVLRPDGITEENNRLRDLKLFLGHDYPGVTFIRRAP